MKMSYFCSANFHICWCETDVVHHRTARWEKDRKRKPGKAASIELVQPKYTNIPWWGSLATEYQISEILKPTNMICAHVMPVTTVLQIAEL